MGEAVLTNSTSASATVTGLTNGTAYVFKVAGVNGVGTGSYSSGVSTIPVTFTVCGGPGNGCYDSTASISDGAAKLPDGSIIDYTFANGSSGFKVWKERGGNRILNATGLWSFGWQKQLTSAGTSYSNQDFITSTRLGGRICPPHVFIDFNNMTANNRCLYFDTGNLASGITDIGRWSWGGTGRGGGSSFFEGNVSACSNSGMRLPTIYETTASDPGSGLPGSDGISPTWAGTTRGVPSFGSGVNWTASAHTSDSNHFWVWENSSASYYGMMGWGGSGPAVYEGHTSSLLSVRCVLP
ncbi:MAG: fibronectin type III domain-containing protein [Proteobacteria bacterium]|nr:fibronectin type III domain-containing protein [Pseudomonadota bacterium]